MIFEVRLPSIIMYGSEAKDVIFSRGGRLSGVETERELGLLYGIRGRSRNLG